MSYVVWALFSHHRLLCRMVVACHCGLMGDMGDMAAVCNVVALWMVLGLQTIQQYCQQSLVKALQVLVQRSLQECQLFRLVLS